MKKLVVLILIILTIGLIPIWINYGHDYKCVDLIGQQIPFILETKRMFATGAPWWSWNTFLGDNFLGAYSFYTMTSPFVWLICLFPTDKILLGILISLYLKTICTGVAAGCYFKKMGFDSNLCTVGALLYCFSSFYICNLFYFHFCEPIMVLPLLLIALEGVIKGEKYSCLWLAIASFGVVFINFYFALPTFLLGIVYFLFRSFGARKLTPALSLRAAMCVAVGIGMAAFILYVAILHNVGGGRSFLSYHIETNPFRVVSNFLKNLSHAIIPSVAEGQKGNYNSTQPYQLLFGLSLSIFYCVKKRNWLSGLYIFLLICYFTPLNGVFSGFTSSTYTRWLYGLNLIGSITILNVLKSEIVPIKYIVLYMSGCIAVLCIFLCNQLWNDIEYLSEEKVEIGLFIANSICLIIWAFNQRRIALTLVLITICGSLNLFATTYIYTSWGNPGNEERPDYIYRDIFNAEFADSAPIMTSRTDVLSSTTNYSLLNNSPGIYGFHSSMNKSIQPLRQAIQGDLVSPTFSCSAHRESSSTLLSVKEIKDFHDPNFSGVDYERDMKLVGNLPTHSTYILNNYLPMGFAYDSYVDSRRIEELSSCYDEYDIPLLLLDNIAVESGDIPELSRYLRQGTLNNNVKLDSIAGLRKRATAVNFIGDSKGFRCNTNFTKTEVVFFSVPADPGFTACIDGERTKIYKVNLGMMGIVVPPGCHDIDFKYFTPGLKTGSIISLCSLALLLLMVCFPLFMKKL